VTAPADGSTRGGTHPGPFRGFGCWLTDASRASSRFGRRARPPRRLLLPRAPVSLPLKLRVTDSTAASVTAPILGLREVMAALAGVPAPSAFPRPADLLRPCVARASLASETVDHPVVPGVEFVYLVLTTRLAPAAEHVNGILDPWVHLVDRGRRTPIALVVAAPLRSSRRRPADADSELTSSSTTTFRLRAKVTRSAHTPPIRICAAESCSLLPFTPQQSQDRRHNGSRSRVTRQAPLQHAKSAAHKRKHWTNRQNR
jgi:hypothetical protein